MKTLSANAIAETFERDRGVVIRALRDTKPDAMVSGKPQWKVATAARALERHNRVSDGGHNGSGIDPGLAAIHAEFDAKYAAVVAAPSLAKRRAMALKLAPLIGEMDRTFREVSRANGQDDEVVQLRADRLYMLVLIGFEKCCEWSRQQTFEMMDNTASA
jgi:hypothetical protein